MIEAIQKDQLHLGLVFFVQKPKHAYQATQSLPQTLIQELTEKVFYKFQKKVYLREAGSMMTMFFSLRSTTCLGLQKVNKIPQKYSAGLFQHYWLQS